MMSLSTLQIYYYPGNWMQYLPAHNVCTISTPLGAFQPGVTWRSKLFDQQWRSHPTGYPFNTIVVEWRINDIAWKCNWYIWWHHRWKRVIKLIGHARHEQLHDKLTGSFTLFINLHLEGIGFFIPTQHVRESRWSLVDQQGSFFPYKHQGMRNTRYESSL